MSADGSTTIVGAIVAVGGLVLGLIGQSIRATWKIAEAKEKVAAESAAMRLEIRAEQDTVMKQFGESVAAVRQKITDTEIWNRDHFVRRTDFAQVIEGIHRSIDSLSAKMDAGFTKMEGKIDKLADHR